MRAQITSLAALKSAEITTTIPGYEKWTALDKHAFAFGEKTSMGEINFSSDTITETAKKQGAKNPGLTGSAVNFFNKFVPGQCPIGKDTFSIPGKTTEYKSKLHAGTFEIFEQNGGINWIRLNAVANFENKTTGLISLSDVLDNLKIKTGNNKFQADTRRDHNCISRGIEAFSTEFAWSAIFEMLVCQWQPKKDKPSELEPLVDAELLKLFFTDTPVCFAIARELQLPRKQPETEKTFCCC